MVVANKHVFQYDYNLNLFAGLIGSAVSGAIIGPGTGAGKGTIIFFLRLCDDTY